MKSGPERVLQVLLWGVCAAHLVIGVGLNLMGADMVKSLAGVYGTDITEWNAQFLYIVKPLGAFMIALGILAGVAARDPKRFRPVVYGFVVLFVLRGLQRVAFGDEIQDVFGVDQGRNIGNAVFFLLYAAAMVVCDRMASKSAPPVASAA